MTHCLAPSRARLAVRSPRFDGRQRGTSRRARSERDTELRAAQAWQPRPAIAPPRQIDFVSALPSRGESSALRGFPLFWPPAARWSLVSWVRVLDRPATAAAAAAVVPA